MVDLNSKGREMTMLNSLANSVFNEAEIVELATKYGDANNHTSISELIDYAVRYDFHFDLFIEMIPRFPSPFNALRLSLPHYFNLMKTEARGIYLYF